ncbi:hypothetical protein [Arthrobacter sp. NPDC058192]|uniref:hypothetical protein n=1 Tax=Arthrobacter sp. NPDC058192 TaxID=3346372 RepID=UPI0036E58786
MNSPEGVTLDTAGNVVSVDPLGVIFNGGDDCGLPGRRPPGGKGLRDHSIGLMWEANHVWLIFIFGVSSVLVPYGFDATAGGIASGQVPAGGRAGDPLGSRVNPTSVVRVCSPYP